MHVKIVQIVSGVSSVLFKQRQAIVLRRPHEETSQSSSKQRNQERIEVQHTAVVGVMAFSLVHARTAVVVKYGSNTAHIFNLVQKAQGFSSRAASCDSPDQPNAIWGVSCAGWGTSKKYTRTHGHGGIALRNQSNHAPYPCQTSNLM